MKKILSTLFFFVVFVLQSQNKKILYGFDNIPQGLLLNPGQENPHKVHIGIPLLSGGRNFNIKVRNALNNIGDKDYISANAQLEILSGGYKLNGRDYLSFGFYQEADAFFGFPKDVFDLIIEGNGGENINRSFTASGIAFKTEILGVLHAGVTRRFNSKFTAGARLKIYSSAINITSNNNEGTFLTTRNTDIEEEGIFTNSLNNLDVSIETSGIVNESEIESKDVIGDTFFGGNLGLGLDFGFTYHMTEQLEFTGSLLDIGFISQSKNTDNLFYKGDYSFSGVNFEYSEARNYIQELEDDFNDNVSREDDKESYITLRPLKFNSSVRYSFGKSRYLANCHDIRYKDFYDNAVGAQLYAITRPYGLRMALTGFYEHKFAQFLNTKVTWTVDDFSYTNFGLGVSTNFWKLNAYGMIDNIFKAGDITDAHTFSVQFGVNLIFN